MNIAGCTFIFLHVVPWSRASVDCTERGTEPLPAGGHRMQGRLGFQLGGTKNPWSVVTGQLIAGVQVSTCRKPPGLAEEGAAPGLFVAFDNGLLF
jgi:hypothetical protein